MELKNFFAQDKSGNALPGATCYLYIPGTSTPATALQDQNGNPLGNPFHANEVGLFQFSAPDGEYDLHVISEGRAYTVRVQCLDVTAQLDSANAAVAVSTEAADRAEAAAIFLPAGTGAVSRTAQDKLRERVSVKDFGATGNGVTDDTDAVQKATAYALAMDGKVVFPAGTYLMTDGVSTFATGQAFHWEGEGRAVIKFDADASKHLLNFVALYTNIKIHNLSFKSSAKVTGRTLLRVVGSIGQMNIDKCLFTSNDSYSFEFATGSYLQNWSMTDCSFFNTGFIKPTGARNLICTLMNWRNVNHDGTCSDNDDKVVLDLSNIHMISFDTVLLEGAVPIGSDWTVIRNWRNTNQSYSPSKWEGQLIMRNCWAEFASGSVTKIFDLDGALVTSEQSVGFCGMCSLSGASVLNITNGDEGGTPINPSNFVIADEKSRVNISNSQVNYTGYIDSRISLINCFYVGPSSYVANPAEIDNTASTLLWSWQGEMLDAVNTDIIYFDPQYAWHVHWVIKTDSLFGRIIEFDSRGEDHTLPPFSIYLPIAQFNGRAKDNDQFFLQVLIYKPAGITKIRAYSGGSNGGVNPTNTFIPDVDNTFQWVTIPIRVNSGIAVLTSNLAVSFGGYIVDSGIVPAPLNQKVAAINLYAGKSFPQTGDFGKPKFVEMRRSAAPTEGTWAAGDRVINSAPAVGSSKAWICTVAGTPGTWVSEGSL